MRKIASQQAKDKPSPWSPESVARRDEGRARLAAALEELGHREAHRVALAAQALYEDDAVVRAARQALDEAATRKQLEADGHVRWWGGRRRIRRSIRDAYRANLDAVAGLPDTAADPVTRARTLARGFADERPWLRRAAAVRRCSRCRVAYAAPSPGAEPVPVIGGGGLVVARVEECGQRLCPECAPRRARTNGRKLRALVKALDQRARLAKRGVLRAAERARLDDAIARVAWVEGEVFPGADEAGPSPVLEQMRRAGVLGDVRDLDGFELRPADHRRIGASRIAGRLALVEARDAVHVARKRLTGAIAREQAVEALRSAEVQAAAARRARARASAAAALIPHVVDSVEVGPHWLKTRDAERWPSVLARVDEGDTRAMATLMRLSEEARTRAARAYAQHVEDMEVIAAKMERDAQQARDDARRQAAEAGLWQSSDVRLITLTQRPRAGETCGAAMARLRRGLLRLSRSKTWKAHVAGATWKVEAEWSTPDTRAAKAAQHRQRAAEAQRAGDVKDADTWAASAERLTASSSWASSGCHWHVHAHVLASCGWWSADDLGRLWRRALEGQGTAHIARPRRGVTGVVDEVAKYLSKPTTTRDVPIAQLQELLQAIEGRRLLWTTGAMRGADLVDLDAEPTERVEGADVGDVVGVAGTRPVRREAIEGATADGWDAVQWRDDAEALCERLIRLDEASRRHKRNRVGTQEHVTSSAEA